MNKKPGLLFAVTLLAIIVLMTAFNVDFISDMQNLNINVSASRSVSLPNGVNPDSVLYVCPVAHDTWDSIAQAMRTARRFITMFAMFAIIILSFSWAWALYQNLIKDKFSADAYKNPWTLTKAFFWGGVICAIVLLTPNYFRKVSVHHRGTSSEWVLCESFSPGARPVNAKAVKIN